MLHGALYMACWFVLYCTWMFGFTSVLVPAEGREILSKFYFKYRILGKTRKDSRDEFVKTLNSVSKASYSCQLTASGYSSPLPVRVRVLKQNGWLQQSVCINNLSVVV